jgi:phosphoribosylglycinamide formyltransferase-1
MTENQEPVRVAIFASGAGSNAQKIVDYFRNNNSIKISLIVCNKPEAGVLHIADKEDIPALLINRGKFFNDDAYLSALRKNKIDFIVLAGFLWKIPLLLIQAYPYKIINIHPALLPKHGGKNMYGSHVHEAVIASGSKESGITIHYVDEHYDNGDIVFQAKFMIDENETPETLAQKIHLLEYKNYPPIIEEVINKQFVKIKTD